MSSGIGQEPEAARKGEVWDQQSSLYQHIAAIRKLVAQLEERLCPVLQPHRPPTGVGEQPETPKEPSVPVLIKQLRANNDDLQSIEGRLGSLMERLEI